MKRVITPTVIQMEAVECGAAALSIVLGSYGCHLSLEELREMCGVSRSGVNAFNLVQAARHYGLEAEGYQVDIEALRQLPRPSILHWDQNHFVVLEGFEKERVYINDPATGPRSLSLEEFERHFSQVVLTFTLTDTFQKRGKPQRLWDAILERIQPFKETLIYLFILQFLLVILGLAMPVAFQIFVDKIMKEWVFIWKWPFLSILGGVLLVTGLITWIQGMALNYLQARLAIRYSTEFLWHVLRLPMNFFTQRFGGEIIYRMILNQQVAAVLTGQVVVTIMNLLLIGIYGIIMFQYDSWIASIGIATALFNMWLLYAISRVRTNAYARMQQEQAKTVGVSLDVLEHIETMKAACNDSYFFSRISGFFTKTINAMQDIGNKDVWLTSLSSLSQGLSGVFLLGFGTWRVMHGNLTIGMLIALQVILNNFLRPFQQLVGFGTTLQTLRIDLNRLDDVLKNREDPLAQEQADVSSAKKLDGKLQLEAVSFGYSPLEEPFIQNFSLSLEKGQWKALVGSVGCGKTTLAKLCCGLYQPRSGKILYDGKLISAYSHATRRNSIAHVDQDIFLFGGTVRENLTLWNPEVSDEKMMEAAKDAMIHEEIMNRPEGYEAIVIEDGRNFSQGQRQRLEIARALLMCPTLLIMDEATSALDSETEAQVVANIRRRGCTCLVIAHRLSTIRDCDEIVVIDNGVAIQRGTHATLKQEAGAYRSFILENGGDHA